MKEAPQILTDDLIDTLQKIKDFRAPEHVAFFNFDGGLRDFLVGEAMSESAEAPESAKPTANTVFLHLETIKNVQMSLNHNSQLYALTWLN